MIMNNSLLAVYAGLSLHHSVLLPSSSFCCEGSVIRALFTEYGFELEPCDYTAYNDEETTGSCPQGVHSWCTSQLRPP